MGGAKKVSAQSHTHTLSHTHSLINASPTRVQKIHPNREAFYLMCGGFCLFFGVFEKFSKLTSNMQLQPLVMSIFMSLSYYSFSSIPDDPSSAPSSTLYTFSYAKEGDVFSFSVARCSVLM